jgi:hypothetical protein
VNLRCDQCKVGIDTDADWYTSDDSGVRCENCVSSRFWTEGAQLARAHFEPPPVEVLRVKGML